MKRVILTLATIVGVVSHFNAPELFEPLAGH